MRRRSFLALFSSVALGAFRAVAAETSTHAVWSPLTIAVSLDRQHLTVFSGDREIAASPISSGRPGHATPTGIFSILDKRRYHRSNIYSNAPMPFMQRLTWSGIALHASNHVPGYPASHGCLRMPEAFARKLYAMTELNAHVVITDAPTRPQRVAHERLFQPRPPAQQFLAGGLKLRLDTKEIGENPIELAAATGASAVVTDALDVEVKSPLRLLVTRRTHNELTRDVQHLLNVLGFDAGEVDGFIGPQTTKALKAFQREAALPTTGVISRIEIDRLHEATRQGPAPMGHLYARQNFTPLFDVPILIETPERPLGAHLLTVETIENGRAEWLGMSLSDAPRPSVRNAFDIITQAEQDTAAPRLAKTLDRLVIEEATRRRVAKLLTRGSSLAISDNGLGPETGKGTDFIVLTRG